MKHSEADTHRTEIRELVNAFIASAALEFAPIVAAPTGRWSMTVEQATSEGMVEVLPENISGLFFVTASFANNMVAGQLSFGDRELLVNAVLGPAADKSHYALWEWADALNHPKLVPRDTAFVITVSRLESIVAEMVSAVSLLQPLIATSSPAVIERIENAREAAYQSFQRQVAEGDHRRASAAAAQAFHAGDYLRTISFLEPIEASLTPAERAKLTYARKHVRLRPSTS